MKKIDAAMEIMKMHRSVFQAIEEITVMSGMEIHNIFDMFDDTEKILSFLAGEPIPNFYDNTSEFLRGEEPEEGLRERLLFFSQMENKVFNVEWVMVLTILAEIEKKRWEVYEKYEQTGVIFDFFDRIEPTGVIDSLVKKLVGDTGEWLHPYSDGEMSIQEVMEYLDELFEMTPDESNLFVNQMKSKGNVIN
ncbi:hypothetical protein LG291_25345 (plasmid) [Cytobacillus firmus]|uniref:Uncharacterized protein n=1 Tax=Cytobacillus firmus DS1 TaxID=1307436 RepID=W7KPG6_CYTFI|nr:MULTISPECIES: hypothetical protein [Bacillaceae]EWG09360.1 hypothetical protein PBF_19728 [Cytobacillus firmus DS1]MBN8202552.1 hypothetical protein [Bacillus sp. NTK034]